MIQSQLMSSRNLTGVYHARLVSVKTLVDIQQSLSPDLSQLGDILVIIIQICNGTIRLLETNKELIELKQGSSLSFILTIAGYFAGSN